MQQRRFSKDPDSPVSEDQGRKLILSGTLTLTVKSVQAAATALERIARESGGYLAESEVQRTSSGAWEGNLLLRLPSERLPSAGPSIRALGTVQQESSAVEDVTKTYSDLALRLQVKRETQTRVQTLLRDHTAKLADVLEAEKELGRLTEEIEGMERQRRGLDQRIALAELRVHLTESEALFTASSWEPLTEAFRDISKTLAGTLGFLIYFLTATLPWVFIGLGTFWGIRRWRRRNQPSETKAPSGS